MRKEIKTAIYACGGLATKLVSAFETAVKQDGFDHLSFGYIDTSGSDLSNVKDNLFLVPDMDGGGKDRRITYGQIAPHVPSMIQKFEPLDFNIVVHSASGGSGSVIGPAITQTLLKQGKPVIVIAVGSVGSKVEVRNSIATIKTLSNYAQQEQTPLLMYYRENNPENPRSRVDSEIQSALFLAALLFSSENKGIDTTDLKNFLSYNKVTSFDPELSSLEFFQKDAEMAKQLVPQAAVIMFSAEENSADEHEKGLSVLEYRAEGFLSEKRTSQLGSKTPIYAIAYTGEIVDHLKNLDEHMKRFEAAELARKSSVTSVGVTATETDQVF